MISSPASLKSNGLRQSINTGQGLPFPEVDNANRKGGLRTSVVRKPGPKRQGRSMGRYPFLEVAKSYLTWRKGFLNQKTYERMERNFRYLNKVFQNLKAEGKVDTTNPAKFNRKEIGAFVECMRSQGKQGSYIAKLNGLLKDLCVFSNNTIFDRLKMEGEDLPKPGKKAIDSRNEADIFLIMKKSEELGEGWEAEVTRFLCAILPYSGLRPGEIRNALVEDINIRDWSIWVRTPKGSGKYSEQRPAPIANPARKAVLRYLNIRNERLRALNIEDAKPLIPALHDGEAGFYAESTLRKFIGMVNDKLDDDPSTKGIRVSLKTFRASYCQMIIDKDPSRLSDVSATMGHSTTNTTEGFYGRISQKTAVGRINSLWEPKVNDLDLKASSIPKSPLIEKGKWDTGYIG
jgi:integrase